MIKLIFIAVIVLASAGIGNVIVGDWAERKEGIARLQNAVKTLKNALIYQGMPLYDALLQAGKPPIQVFSACAQRLRKTPGIEGKTLCLEAMQEQKRPSPRSKNRKKSVAGSFSPGYPWRFPQNRWRMRAPCFYGRQICLPEKCKASRNKKGGSPKPCAWWQGWSFRFY